MSEPRASVLRFVSRVVRAEAAAQDAESDVRVVERVITKVYGELAKLIGPAGLDVLVARSVALARRAHPILGTIKAGPGGKLSGIDDASRGDARLREGAIAMIAHLIELLVGLIGEDLLVRLLRDLWPTASMDMDEEERTNDESP